MCGIFCAVSSDNNVSCLLHSFLAALLHNRGPDAQDIVQLEHVMLAGNVLWQQGATPQVQPISLGDFVLLFNGDLYNVDEEKPKNLSDSAWLAQQFALCTNDADKLKLLKRLEGPHCLVLYNKAEQMLYFARDALGRNSLIIERQMQAMCLLSTSYYLEQQSDTIKALELPPLGLYKVQVQDLSKCVLYPWQTLNEGAVEQLNMLDAAMKWKTQVDQLIAPQWLIEKIQKIPAFDFYEHCNNAYEPEALYQKLLSLPAVLDSLDTLDKLLQNSVAARIRHTAPFCRECLRQPPVTLSLSCSHAKICLLYSGGIDCSILALLADKFVPSQEPIELINVAFERIVTNGTAALDWNVPDRLTALQSHAELQRLCPQRQWKLIEVNVTRAELKQQLAAHIRQLIYPLGTVLDESIGCAFWFAASAAQSSSRVALLGSGADELFGGYIRHRNAYRRCTGDEQMRQQAVLQELEMDWQRIPARNLARDDRVIADSGKTARAPFIEEHLVQFVRSLQPQQRCCFNLAEGVGDKLLLRLYGYRLGLRDATLLKKRAIQFGSRIADKKQQARETSCFLKF